MDDNIAPKIWEYTRQIAKNAFGAKAGVAGFEWSDGGGLFCKVFKVVTSEGIFILKVERDKIFFPNRKDQIENEVLGNAIFQKAGIACPDILAYDFTKSETGVRYVFMEHIKNDKQDWPANPDDFDEETKAEIKRQYQTAIDAAESIKNTHFGSLSPLGTIGRHETYDGYYHNTLNLFIKESEELGLFTGEELDAVKKAAAKPLVYSNKYIPTFTTGDLGYHNCIWGSPAGGENRLYVYDFGNAYYGLPHEPERIRALHGEGGILEAFGLEKELYENDFIGNFEKMFWTVTQQLTRDYDYGRMVDWTKEVKRENSKTHIKDFVDSCLRYI
ncbi:MAG: phosphotransferase [Oscillospiraceae bacterium]|nr:phosphotransferase [Oscillospiraceae bacterium]